MLQPLHCSRNRSHPRSLTTAGPSLTVMIAHTAHAAKIFVAGHQLQMKCADPLSQAPLLLWEDVQLIFHQKITHGFCLQRCYHPQKQAIMDCKCSSKHEKY